MWGGRKKNIRICTWFHILDIPLGIRWEMYPKSKSSQEGMTLTTVNPHRKCTVRSNSTNKKTTQTIWDYDIALVKPMEDMTETCHCPLCLFAQERQLSFLGRVLLGNCMGGHNSTAGFLRSGRVGIIFPFKSKYTEEDYVTHPVSSTYLYKEAKYLKCWFLG